MHYVLFHAAFAALVSTNCTIFAEETFPKKKTSQAVLYDFNLKIKEISLAFSVSPAPTCRMTRVVEGEAS